MFHRPRHSFALLLAAAILTQFATPTLADLGDDAPTGTAEMVYDLLSGEVWFDIGGAGEIAVVGLELQGAAAGSLITANANDLNGTNPGMNDGTVLAYFGFNGLPDGEDSVGLILPTGLGQSDIGFSYTPLGGMSVQQLVTLIAVGPTNLGGNNVSIASASTQHMDLIAGRAFHSTDENAVLDVSDFDNAIAAATDIYLNAGDGGANSQAGNVTFDTQVDIGGATARTITVRAANDVVINQPLVDSTPGLDEATVRLIADETRRQTGGSPAGEGDVQVNAPVTIADDELIASGVNFSNPTGAITAELVDLDFDGQVDVGSDVSAHDIAIQGNTIDTQHATLAATNSLTLTATHAIDLGHVDAPGATVQTSGTDLTIQGPVEAGALDMDHTGPATINAGVTADDVTIRASSIDSRSVSLSAVSGLTLDASGRIDLGEVIAPGATVQTSGMDLAIHGPIVAGTVNANHTGPVTIDADVDGDSVMIAGTTIDSRSVWLSAANGLTLDASGRIDLGEVIAPGATVQTSGMDLAMHGPIVAGTLNANHTGPVTIDADVEGDIVMIAGTTIDSQSVSLEATSELTLDATNDLLLGPIAANGAAVQTSGTDLTIHSPVEAGTLTINQSGSVLINAGMSAGTMTITGSVIDTRSTVLTAAAQLTLGVGTSAEVGALSVTNAKVRLTGPGAVHPNQSISAQELEVSGSTLHIAGGQVIDVGTYTQTSGETVLSGGTMEIGQLALSGGTVTWTAGILDVQEDLQSSVLTNRGVTTIGSGQTLRVGGTFTVDSSVGLAGGVVEADESQLAGAATLEGYGLIHTSRIEGAAESSIEAIGGDLVIGDNTRLDTFRTAGDVMVGSGAKLEIRSLGFALLGSMTHLAGGSIEATSGISLGEGDNLQGHGVVDAPFRNAAGTTVLASGGDLTLGSASAGNGFASSGQLSTGSHAVTLLDADRAGLGFGSVTSLGTATADGTVVAPNGLDVTQGASITGRGLIDTPDDPFKALVNNGTISGLSASEPLVLSGYVKGVGGFDHVTVTGTFSPGLSPAQVFVGSMGLEGVTIMELGGLTPGDYDQLVSSGDLALSGTLKLTLIDGFQPAFGDTFLLFDADLLNGSFSSYALPDLGGGLSFDTTDATTEGMVSVVPEPATSALLAVGFVLFMRRSPTTAP